MVKRAVRIFWRTGVVGLAILSLLTYHIRPAFAVTRTWDNDSTDGLWSTCANWSGNVCPGSSDIATFDATSNTASTIDAGFAGSIAGLNVTAAYTNTITMAHNLTVGTSNFTLSGGTFAHDTHTLAVSGNIVISSATFNGGSGIITAGNGLGASVLSITGAGASFRSTSGTFTLTSDFTLGSGATFDANGGTVLMNAGAGADIDVPTTVTFNNLSIDSSPYVITSGDTVVVAGSLVFVNGASHVNTGTLEAQGGITFGALNAGGTGTLHITGLAARTITIPVGTDLMNTFYLDAPNVTVSPSASGAYVTSTLHISQGIWDGGTSNSLLAANLTLDGGTFDSGTSQVTTSSTMTVSAGTFDGTDSPLVEAIDLSLSGGTLLAPTAVLEVGGDITYSGGTFTHNNGVVRLNGGTSQAIDGTLTFYNLYDYDGDDGYTLTLTAGDTVTVLNDMRLEPNDCCQLNLVSSVPASQANLDVQGTAYIYKTDAQDINYLPVTRYPCYVFCADSGNNTNMRFGEPGYVITDISSDVTEAGTAATFQVSLRGEPLSSVVIPVSSSDLTEATVSAPSLTFTTSNYATPQTVTVTGVDDGTDDGGMPVTITLGAPTTSDALYAVLNPDDVSLTTLDNEDDAASIDFDNTSDYTAENVVAAPLSTVGWFTVSSQGEGNFKVSNGGANVSLVGSSIQAGCTATIGGNDYVIESVVTASTGDVILTQVGVNPVDISGTLVSAAVTAITCTEHRGDGFSLNVDDILAAAGVTDVTSTSRWITYDATNNALWVSDQNNDQIYKISAASGALLATITTGTSPMATAYDATDDILWVANFNDSTVTGIDGSSAAYINGTLGASSFAAGDNPDALAFDADHDYLWVGNIDGASALDASDGSTLASFTWDEAVDDITYDSADNTAWAMINDGFGETISYSGFYKLDADTLDYANVTSASSFYPLPSDSYLQNAVYDTERDVIWVADTASLSPSAGSPVLKFDPNTGRVIGGYRGQSSGAGLAIDPVRDLIYSPNNLSNTISAFSAALGTTKRHYTSVTSPNQVAVDSTGDVWGIDSSTQAKIYHYAPDAAPVSAYYTITSKDAAQVDTSTWTDVTGATVSETLNGQNIYYAVSFDGRHTWNVYGSSWRPIASDLNSVHGGTDGVWYFRDDADVWTVATGNTGERAISQAVNAGSTNNRTLTGSALAGLSSGSWSGAGGFADTQTTLDLAATLHTSDDQASPVTDGVVIAFATSGGGGGGGGGGSTGGGSVIFVTEPSLTITPQPCVATTAVTLDLRADGATQVEVSNDASFIGATWMPYVVDVDTGLMQIPWDLALPDGTKTVYAKFKSATGNLSPAVSDEIVLDTATSCTVVTPPVTPPVVTPPVTPTVTEGEFVRTEGNSTVYYSNNGTLQPFNDLASYLTYTGMCGAVTFVDDATVAGITRGSTMLPKAHTILVSFPNDARVYVVDGTVDAPVLRWVASEVAAAENFGPNWPQSVILLGDPGLYSYTLGTDVTGAEAELMDDVMYTRAALTQSVSYDVYAINPDGSKRSVFSSDVHVTKDPDGTLVYGIEDKGEDNDYNDVVIDLDPRECLDLKISVRPLEAAWHHKLGITIFYEGALESDMILWPDSHTAVGQVATVHLSNVTGLQNVDFSTTPTLTESIQSLFMR